MGYHLAKELTRPRLIIDATFFCARGLGIFIQGTAKDTANEVQTGGERIKTRVYELIFSTLSAMCLTQWQVELADGSRQAK